MTEHYSGNDPARGCGLAVVLGMAIWIAIGAIAFVVDGVNGVLIAVAAPIALIAVVFAIGGVLMAIVSYLGTTAGRSQR